MTGGYDTDDEAWIGDLIDVEAIGDDPSVSSMDTLVFDLDDDGGKRRMVVQLPNPGDTVSGRYTYRIGQRIGSGAFSAVYAAACLDTGKLEGAPPRQVAIKVLSLASTDGGAEGVRRELSSLLAIRCDNIPRVYDWSLDESRVFVVMQYYAGGSLRARMPVTGPVDEDEAWRLLEDLLIALVAAHKSSILHLDIKPANVLLNDDGRYVLTDFGISQGSRAGRESIKMLGMGTPGYQAPEQRWNRPDLFDMRTDLFGVGATVWACYTGINLANGANDYLLAQNWDATYGLPKPSQARSFCSQELELILLSLLLQDSSKRPGSAAEVLEDIRRVRGPGANDFQLPGVEVGPELIHKVMADLIDPVWNNFFRTGGTNVRKLVSGEYLCLEGDRSYHTYVLLSGEVEVLLKGRSVATEDREGTFLGEVSALTGGQRTATLRAVGDVYVRVLNASQLERLVSSNPALGVRLIRSMAERLARS